MSKERDKISKFNSEVSNPQGSPEALFYISLLMVPLGTTWPT